MHKPPRCGINMPGMDGFELLERMRGDEPLSRVAVVMCTGSEYEKDRERARALGTVGYLVKPPQFDELRPLLEHVPALHLSREDGGYALRRAARVGK